LTSDGHQQRRVIHQLSLAALGLQPAIVEALGLSDEHRFVDGAQHQEKVGHMV